MQAIYLPAGAAGRQTAQLLCRLLHQQGRQPLLIWPGQPLQSPAAAQTLLAALPGRLLCGQDDLLVLPPGDYRALQVCGRVQVITDSQNAAGRLPHFSLENGAIISCGMASKDTFTLSSHTSDSAVVTLQRPLKALAGHQLDPGDFPLAFKGPVPAFALMAGVAALLLLGLPAPRQIEEAAGAQQEFFPPQAGKTASHWQSYSPASRPHY